MILSLPAFSGRFASCLTRLLHTFNISLKPPHKDSGHGSNWLQTEVDPYCFCYFFAGSWSSQLPTSRQFLAEISRIPLILLAKICSFLFDIRTIWLNITYHINVSSNMYYIQLIFLPRYPFSWTQLKLSSSVTVAVLFFPKECCGNFRVQVSLGKTAWKANLLRPVHALQCYHHGQVLH